METPLTPLEFARRARQLYGSYEAVIEGAVRLTYQEFFRRCDRWSAALQYLGVGKGDRVAYIAPNTHAQLEAFYAVPQIGAVLVPINYRLIADDFAYIIAHSGARVVCVDAEYLEAVESIQDRLPDVEHFVALDGARDGWLDYETLLEQSGGVYARPDIAEGDLLTINYTSGTTARPKGVMITHRNAYLNILGTLAHLHLTPVDSYLWTLPMFHANGWTFVWTVTAVGARHVCLRRVEPARVLETLEQERVTVMCAAPTVLVALANSTEQNHRGGTRQGLRVLTGGAPPAPATIERLESQLGWEVIHVYGLTETSPFVTLCETRPEHARLSGAERSTLKSRQGVEWLMTGQTLVVDEHDREVPHDGQTMGEIVVRGNVVMRGYYRDFDASEEALRGGWLRTGDVAVVHADGYLEIRDRRKDIIISGGENISSVEVEHVLMRHPSVREVAVVGMPDERWGSGPITTPTGTSPRSSRRPTGTVG
jgi:fatty-acyl-CoA synthase